LDPEVRLHEPHLALDGGGDGLDFYRRLAGEAHSWLAPNGWLLAEFGDGQSAALRSLFDSAPWIQLSIHSDLGGRERVLSVQKRS